MSVPTRRFGRTEVQMPVLSCGGMRYQQGWDDLEPEKIDPKIQDNLEATVHRALELGISHIETARGYGPSEMQLGWVLPEIDRESYLLQTKIGVKETAEEFLEVFETSMKNLQVDYVDFLSIHGINLPEHIDTCLKKGGCVEAVRKLQQEGRVRFCGFSTHGGPEVVVPACETGEFDYVNLHWYFIYDPLHWPMVEAAAKQDMGVFIISPNDKGGMLYKPTEKMAALCNPLTPMQWNDLYCLQRPEVHTLSIGAAKPSDFEEHVEAVSRHLDDPIVGDIEQRIIRSLENDLGADWMRHWHEGLPFYLDVPGEINVREILRLWTFDRGLGLREFAKMRYNLLGNASHWFPGQQAAEVDSVDWSCLKNSRFADRIPDLLKEAHALYWEDKEAKRLSES
ncbi:aldo/keto reductase [Pontiella agarivorans]|uniref:Aldo/keto reductase n=1 Tax=Pontiella agarivorans TaxID=3038953 RepID=A0ABU5MTG1_9BACT|nr:aldo/keto reductase [Pontiella agarivorans]MDZ8117427.1 aldo/keto reductase [Pontiella agarivorans]